MTMKFARLLAFLVVIGHAAPAAFAQPAPPPLTPSVAPAVVTQPAAQPPADATEEYVIGPEDTIEIGILGQADRTRARVYTDGSIQLNLLGRVMVAGRNPRQLGAELAKAFEAGGYYSNPIVSVEIVGYASRYVTVLGAFGQPGLIPMNRSYHLSEILARVGGVRDTAADYIIVRSEGQPEKRYLISKLSSGDAADDPQVAPGDKIFSPTAEVFYVSGQVKGPGAFPVTSGLTIAQAIAKAGGLTDSGSDKKVKVTRAGKSEKMKPDAIVQGGDVLVIGERLF